MDMRDAYFDKLVDLALRDQRVVFLTSDHDAFALKRFRQLIPSRYFNVGIAEQNMVGVASGLALRGFIPFVYGITPFVTQRVYEHLVLDIAAMNLPVHIVGVGSGFSYSTDGPSHHGLMEISSVLSIPGLVMQCSSDPISTSEFVSRSIALQRPTYTSIERGILSDLPRLEGSCDEFIVCRDGSDGVIFSIGAITHDVMISANRLAEDIGISLMVVNVLVVDDGFEGHVARLIDSQKNVFSVEEGYVDGLGLRLSHAMHRFGLKVSFQSLGAQKRYFFESGSRSYMKKLAGISAEQIYEKIEKAYRSQVLVQHSNS